MTRCLHLQDSIRRPELGSAIAVVREKRELHPDEWFKAPKQELIDAAVEAARGIRSLRDRGVLQSQNADHGGPVIVGELIVSPYLSREIVNQPNANVSNSRPITLQSAVL